MNALLQLRRRCAITTNQRLVLLAAGVVGSLMTLVPLTAPAPPVAHADGPSLNGGGSSYAGLEISAWRVETARAPYNLDVNYVASGSSLGRNQYMEGNFDFAASDIPFLEEELTALRNGAGQAGRTDQNFVYVPVSAGGLGFMYNLTDQSGQRVTNLNLPRRTVCRIFTVPNMYWDDAEIVGANPTLRLPHELVRPIVRSDGSGTSYVLSEYCIAIANDVWQPFITAHANEDVETSFKNGGPTSRWPIGWGVTGSALGSDGVSAEVAGSNGKFTITYAEPGAALTKGFPNASVENGVPGTFTQPTELAASLALAYAKGRADGTFELEYNGSDARAYFPSTYSYVIAQTTGFPADKGEVLARFLCYSITKGQREDLTVPLGYARLSEPLVALGRAAIAKIPGAPPWEQCRVDSAPPPTTPTTVAQAVVTTTSVVASGTGQTTTTVAGSATQSTTVSGGTTAAGGTVASGAGTGTGTGTGTGSGSSTGAGSSTGSGATTQTVVSVDPVTGVTTVQTVPAADGGCFDPVTGLPMDPAICAVGNVIVDELIDAAAGESAGAASAAPAAVAPAAINPPIAEAGGGPGAGRIIWWLLQGASICAVGVALAGARKRLA